MPTKNQKQKILLIEDDPFMTNLITNEFGNNNIEVIPAKTGKDGLEKFQEAAPNLIILDILLPDMNGFDLLRQIRRGEKRQKTQVMILSNISEEANIEEAKRLGVTEYLIKANYSLPEIVEKVKKLLE